MFGYVAAYEIVTSCWNEMRWDADTTTTNINGRICE